MRVDGLHDHLVARPQLGHPAQRLAVGDPVRGQRVVADLPGSADFVKCPKPSSQHVGRQSPRAPGRRTSLPNLGIRISADALPFGTYFGFSLAPALSLHCRCSEPRDLVAARACETQLVPQNCQPT